MGNEGNLAAACRGPSALEAIKGLVRGKQIFIFQECESHPLARDQGSAMDTLDMMLVPLF
jgi:hypothetical protein